MTGRFTVMSLFVLLTLCGVLTTLNAVPYESYQRYNEHSESYGFPLTYMTRNWVRDPILNDNGPAYVEFSLAALLSNIAMSLVAFALGLAVFRCTKAWFKFVHEMRELDELLKTKER